MISTQLNGDILKPQFVEQLNYLRDKSKSLPEKEKCDHLSACLTISSKLGSDVKPFRPADKTPQRPKTAMAALGGNLWNPYETSMNRDYPQKVSPQTIAVRPKISKSYRNPYYLCDPIGISMYSDEFGCKPHSTTEPIRAATSSGARNHRPHPDKTFAAWRLPHQEKKMTEDSRSSCIKPLSIAEVQRVMASQYLSTYKRDYLGIPQVPTVTYAHIQNQQNRTQLTTYERHFGKEYVDLSGLVASLDPAEMAGYLQSVPNEERRMLEKFLKAFQQNDNQHLETKSTQTKLN
ncbi:PREDICTED: testis-expressed sequence 26 protein isoform X2 [Nanorana parkeri]|uniref:testis-expressed sequence 26 protein isoform X2 n=1 Tax=Nanorana parkeri TaxID=125878 RepID=UPI0008550998|nr:PREDICTED: testis-expressed sequence 26 protein isoform X2 [Nanorana parkeri]